MSYSASLMMNAPMSSNPPSRTSSQLDRHGPRASATTARHGDARPGHAVDESPLSETALTQREDTTELKRVVFSDPVAFSYLADDASTKVLARQKYLEGYETYVVEQWACSRSHPTFVITTYTGDSAHRVLTNVLGVPADEQKWSPQFAMYDKALRQYHAREKMTPLGNVMVTNLSGFPSSLNVIPIPDGDISSHKELFVVNENLKRLGCSGRAGLKLTEPTGATQAKFQQLYRTSDKVPFNATVVELVKICQVALFLFGKLRADYADGLLCDVTEEAINGWWVEFGTEFYNIEPHDGILGPTTVAALLGMLMGARNRLHACGAPVAKDVFDLEATKRAIAYFQRSQRIEKTRRLDHHTYDRLRRASAKAASGKEWAMPRAVKSTVAELSGKGGEMVMDMVGGRDRGGIADIESADIEVFIEFAQGEKAKWLWHGKPKKHTMNDTFGRPLNEEGLTLQKDDQGGFGWASKRKEASQEDFTLQKRQTTDSEPLSRVTTFNDEDREQASKRTMIFQKASGKMTDARSGLGRIKDAVGRRGHQSRASRDERSARAEERATNWQASQPTLHDGGSQEQGLNNEPRFRKEGSHDATFTRVLSQTPVQSRTALLSPNGAPIYSQQAPQSIAALKPNRDYDVKPTPSRQGPLRNAAINAAELNGHGRAVETPQYGIGASLRRTQSSTQTQSHNGVARHDGWWPRHLSFSLAEDSILLWNPLDEGLKPRISTPKQEMSAEILKAADARRMRTQLKYLESDLGRWIEQKISEVQQLDDAANSDGAALEDIYYPLLEEYHNLRQDTQDLLGQERSQLKEAATDIEQMGDQLEYEIDQLKSKLEDVEDSVGEFERQVRDVESRVKELEDLTTEREGWLHWMFRRATGIGAVASEPAPR